jgi:hypothetical protein
VCYAGSQKLNEAKIAVYSAKSFLGRKEYTKMTKYISNSDYHDCYEYHGSTMIELTRKQDDVTIWRDWIIFDTVEEAAEYFNDTCIA